MMTVFRSIFSLRPMSPASAALAIVLVSLAFAAAIIALGLVAEGSTNETGRSLLIALWFVPFGLFAVRARRGRASVSGASVGARD
jgi:hypothetical protein